MAKLSLSKREYAVAEKLFSQAQRDAKNNVEISLGLAFSLWHQKKYDLAVVEFSKCHQLNLNNDRVIKELTSALIQLNREDEALSVCNTTLKKHPANITALTGRDWVLSKIAPLWHIPMMNEKTRNNAYFESLKSADIKSNHLVFEIGTGSGLLSLMAAKLGAGRVITCEQKQSVALLAAKAVKQNKLNNIIDVLPKISSSVDIGKDMPERADILIHEIFSSELLNEGVIPAIEDAWRRLLKPNAKVIPGYAAIKLALVGGSAIKNNCYVDEVFGFDLSVFNNSQPKKIPIYREDLKLELLSDEFEGFGFDFQNQKEFPIESKEIEILATTSGQCFGLVQWIWLDFGNEITFENHPRDASDTSNWQRILYKFDSPIWVKSGQKLTLSLIHDRNRIWVDLLKAE